MCGENTMPRAATSKRPCSICRKWFLPDARRKGRQKTCGDPACKRELHRRQCSKWNQKNAKYFKSIYLSKKLEKTSKPPPESNKTPPIATEESFPQNRIKLDLPRDVILNEISIRQLIILEYIAEQIRFRALKSVSTTGFGWYKSMRHRLLIPPTITNGFQDTLRI